jgi:hypothetical protein
MMSRAVGAQPPPDSARRDSSSSSQDSLAARLARLEGDVALLRRQLADETRMATRTRSRLGLVLSARVQTNIFANSHRTNNVDVPQYLLAPPATPNPLGSPGTRTLGMSVRQSRLGAAITVDSVLGATFHGDIDMDFFGGASTGPGDRRLFPEPRMRTARAELRWRRTELLVGSETPLISDLNPISVAAVGLPGFVGAGNLWNWLPQIRVTRDVIALGDSRLRIALQGAVLTPFGAAQHVGEPDAVDAGERSARPFLQSRVRVRWGISDDDAGTDGAILEHGAELGVGTHHGWLRVSEPGLQHSRAIAADARVALPGRVELRGEVYRGQLLRGLGGGAIGQTFGRALPGRTLGPALRDVAGWFQLNAEPHPTLITGAGCGFDAVNSDDRPVRQHNSACAVHGVLRPMQPVFIGVELRWLQTRYAEGVYRGRHFNLALGFEL